MNCYSDNLSFSENETQEPPSELSNRFRKAIFNKIGDLDVSHKISWLKNEINSCSNHKDLESKGYLDVLKYWLEIYQDELDNLRKFNNV